MSKVCEHGNLGRMCLVCELTHERDEARAERDGGRHRISLLEKALNEVSTQRNHALRREEIYRAERDAALAERNVAFDARDAAFARAESAERLLTEARRVLREVEWDRSGECPLCGGLRSGDTHVYHASHVEVVRGHFPACALAAVLAQEEPS